MSFGSTSSLAVSSAASVVVSSAASATISEKISFGGTHSAFSRWHSNAPVTTQAALTTASASGATTQVAHEIKDNSDNTIVVLRTINSSCIALSPAVTKIVLIGCEDRRSLSIKGTAISFSNAKSLAKIEVCQCLVLKILGNDLPKTVQTFTVGHCESCRDQLVSVSVRLSLQGFALSNLSSTISSGQSAPAIYVKTKS